MYWYPAQSGTFGSSPWVKHEERTTTNWATQRMPQNSNHEVASRTRYIFWSTQTKERHTRWKKSLKHRTMWNPRNREIMMERNLVIASSCFSWEYEEYYVGQLVQKRHAHEGPKVWMTRKDRKTFSKSTGKDKKAQN
jgi:hypothetical protein